MRYSLPWIAQLTLDTYLIRLSIKRGGIKYHFKVFGITRLGIEPRPPGPLVNTLPTKPMSRYILFYRLIGLVSRVFTNGPGDLGSIHVASYQRL